MLTVDKIEGKIVRVEDEMNFIELELSLFDGEVREGDIIEPTENGRFRSNASATEKRRSEIISLQDSLWE